MQTFTFHEITKEPVLDAAPHHLRMATGYWDGRGNVHCFVDYIDAAQRTRHSWRAELRHYAGPDLRNWKLQEIAARAGRSGEPDSLGVASPHFAAHDGRGYLFYDSRVLDAPGEGFNPGAGRGQPGWMRGEVMVAVCDLAADGRPVHPFRKLGVVAGLNEDWGNSRLGDPYAFVYNGQWHLYHKVRHLREDGTMQVTSALQTCPVDGERFAFQLAALPAVEMSGGGELCRVFRRNGVWHMFYTQWDNSDGGTLWRHAVSQDLKTWECVNKNLFDTARPHPESAPDLCLINGPDGLPVEDQPLTALCTGRDEHDGILKLFHYSVKERD